MYVIWQGEENPSGPPSPPLIQHTLYYKDLLRCHSLEAKLEGSTKLCFNLFLFIYRFILIEAPALYKFGSSA